MPSIDPNLGLTYGWTLGESGWNAGMDANLRRLGAVVQLSVKSRTLTEPPANSSAGDRYLVPAAATGTWAGKESQVAAWSGDAWAFHTPRVGWLCYVEAEGRLCAFAAAGWSAGIAV